MNPYSNIDSSTLGYLSQAGIDPAAGTQPQAPAQGGYPTYPNAAGVGSQTAGTQQAEPQQMQQAPVKNEIPDATARGMSPYSLIGDANYRDREQA